MLQRNNKHITAFEIKYLNNNEALISYKLVQTHPHPRDNLRSVLSEPNPPLSPSAMALCWGNDRVRTKAISYF